MRGVCWYLGLVTEECKQLSSTRKNKSLQEPVNTRMASNPSPERSRLGPPIHLTVLRGGSCVASFRHGRQPLLKEVDSSTSSALRLKAR